MSRHQKYDAICFFGPNPATGRFDRLFTDSEEEAIAFASRGVMGVVNLRDADGARIFQWPPVRVRA